MTPSIVTTYLHSIGIILPTLVYLPQQILKKVLIVEDDIDILDLLEMILRDNGYAVIKINREISIKEIIGISPHMIIIDFLLPHRLGNELCLELKDNQYTSHIPIILYSAVNNLKGIADQSGADAYIEKPFDVNDIINMVNSLAL
jgi:DNA-binding response OmpR family regulator